MMLSKVLTINVILISVVSCGGGHRNENPPPTQLPPPAPPSIDWTEVINTDPTTLSEVELQENYWGYAQHLYQGITESATVGPEPIQQVTNKLLGTGNPLIPYFLNALFSRVITSNQSQLVTGNISEACYVSGSVDLTGELDEKGIGILAVSYNQCNEGNGTITGTGAISLHESSNSDFTSVFFFNEVSLEAFNEEWIITGHYLYGSEIGTEGPFGIYFSSSHLLFEAQSTGIQYLEQLNWRSDGNRGDEDGTSYSGEIVLESLGSVQFTTESKFSSDNNPLYAKLAFSMGDNAIASLEFAAALKLLIDQNADGEPESGKYFISLDHFLNTDFTHTSLEDVEAMNQPPRVLKPYIQPEFAFEGDQLEIHDIRYIDPDTPENELTVSYQWTKWNEIIPDQTESILPAGIATAGDRIRATVIVSDGEFSVSSLPAEVYINAE
ncbi:hypothetical protein [Neptunicella marina]|uniref:Uncharacterized protein n=1 Tax=Neptunicella marina TaxID=2125989 RepID=A0A8J6IRE5_9ALTE|nr:hypothetical protein [Neptunicella marina]MBC3765421.1 hypothetical protein [Neptunicella marina]